MPKPWQGHAEGAGQLLAPADSLPAGPWFNGQATAPLAHWGGGGALDKPRTWR